MDNGSVCSSCHSINDGRRTRCYSCGADRAIEPLEAGRLGRASDAATWSPAAMPAPTQQLRSIRYTGIVLRALAFLIDLVLLSCYWAVLLFWPVTRAWNGPVLAFLLFVAPLVYLLVGWG